MESIHGLLIAWLMSSTALGVGSSTLAIASFLTALQDGQIDQGERRMLGVIYASLRVAMVMIAIALLWLNLGYPGTILGSVFIWTPLLILTLNSVLMTMHWISFKIGPALQAATWYTLGFMLTIEAFNLLPLTWTTFSILYAIDIVLAILIVNVLMWYFMPPKQQK